MCGIGGFAGPEPLDDALADRMLDALHHRGPDGCGRRSWRGDRSAWSLLHTRLSIVDLSPAGSQPMANEDESLWMVFNGEIYNSAELRAYCTDRGHTFRSRSDGEVIIHLWEMEGWRCLRRLNGIFALAMADARSGEVHLARDPLGVKPLFYCRGSENRLWFGSEIRTLLAADCPVGSHDLTALGQFLTFLWVPDPRSPFDHVRAVEPGHVLRWSAEDLQDTVVCDLVGLVHDGTDVPARALETGFGPAVRRQLMADVPVAIMASGGIDSSLIWHQAADTLDAAYTIDWRSRTGSEGLGEDTEAVESLQVQLGTPVRYVPAGTAAIGTLPTSGDLFADPAYELVRSISHAASADGYKVLLSGQGGDELLAGYRRHVAARALGRAPVGAAARGIGTILRRTTSSSVRLEYAARMATALGKRDPFAGYMTLCSYSSSSDRARALDCDEGEVSDEVVWSRHRALYDRMPAEWSMLRKALMLDLCVYLPGLGLAYSDRAGMDAGVEIRVPFLDLDLVRWALSLPDAALVRRTTGKVPARALADHLLGPAVARRPKRGFGVPREMLVEAEGASARGFRQSQYLTLATNVLDRYLATPQVGR